MRTLIGIDKKLADKLRKFAVKKHGVLFGAVKIEAENALRAYLRRPE